MSKFQTVSIGQAVCCLDVFEFRHISGKQERVAFESVGFSGQAVFRATSARGAKTDLFSDVAGGNNVDAQPAID